MSEMKSQLSSARSIPRSHLPIDRFLAAVFILVALTAKPQQPALADSHKSDPLPKELKLYWRGVASRSSQFPRSLLNGMAKCSTTRSLAQHPLRRSIAISDQSALPRSWTEFWEALDETQVWKWVNDYGTKPASTKARAWSVSIKKDSKTVKSSGTNVYPSLADVSKPSDSPAMLNRLWYAVDKLLGRPIEVKGTYLAGFETSRFCPSTEEFKGQYWWLTSTKDFNERYEKLTPKDQGISVCRTGGICAPSRQTGRPRAIRTPESVHARIHRGGGAGNETGKVTMKAESTSSSRGAATSHFIASKNTEPQPLTTAEVQFNSPSNPLLVRPGAVLVIFRLLDLLPNHPQRLLQKRSGLLAVRPLESHGINLDFAMWFR